MPYNLNLKALPQFVKCNQTTFSTDRKNSPSLILPIRLTTLSLGSLKGQISALNNSNNLSRILLIKLLKTS